MNPRRLLLPLLAALVCAALLAPATSGAYVVGVADQNPALFTNTYFEQLAPTRTRYITAIDSVFKQRDTVDAWMDAADAADMEVVVAFNPPPSDEMPEHRAREGLQTGHARRTTEERSGHSARAIRRCASTSRGTRSTTSRSRRRATPRRS